MPTSWASTAAPRSARRHTNRDCGERVAAVHAPLDSNRENIARGYPEDWTRAVSTPRRLTHLNDRIRLRRLVHSTSTSHDTADVVDELSRRAGLRVRATRIARGLSQVALAQHAGVARQTLVLLEAGQLRPRLDTLGHLAEALGVPAALLLAPDPITERKRLRDIVERLPEEALFAVSLVATILDAPAERPAPAARPRAPQTTEKRTSRVRRKA